MASQEVLDMAINKLTIAAGDPNIGPSEFDNLMQRIETLQGLQNR